MDKTRGSKEGSAGYRISSDVDVNLVWRDPSSKDDQLIQVAVCQSSHMLRLDMMSFCSTFINILIKLVLRELEINHLICLTTNTHKTDNAQIID